MALMTRIVAACLRAGGWARASSVVGWSYFACWCMGWCDTAQLAAWPCPGTMACAVTLRCACRAGTRSFC